MIRILEMLDAIYVDYREQTRKQVKKDRLVAAQILAVMGNLRWLSQLA